jgi:hypothetical protein
MAGEREACVGISFFFNERYKTSYETSPFPTRLAMVLFFTVQSGGARLELDKEDGESGPGGRRRMMASVSPLKSYVRPGLSPDRQHRPASPTGDLVYNQLYKEQTTA